CSAYVSGCLLQRWGWASRFSRPLFHWPAAAFSGGSNCVRARRLPPCRRTLAPNGKEVSAPVPCSADRRRSASSGNRWRWGQRVTCCVPDDTRRRPMTVPTTDVQKAWRLYLIEAEFAKNYKTAGMLGGVGLPVPNPILETLLPSLLF